MAEQRRIHQLVHTLSYGDAISTEVIAIQRTCIEAGFVSEIYAINVHPFYKGEDSTAAGPIKSFLELSNQKAQGSETDDAVVLHYSLGSPLNELYRNLNGYKRYLIYHNLTPAKFFEGINPIVAENLKVGERELPLLCECSDRLIADSEFNAKDLKAISPYARSNGVEVLPLLVEPTRFDLPANSGFASLLNHTTGINVLHVGRLVPNKGYEQIIRSFYFLRNHINREARLWLVGIDTDSELYGYALKRMVDAFGLADHVEFVGQRSDDELRALYENCSVYLCLSEHEGFCLPVIEAMHFGLPVISTRSGALEETVGDGGILLDSVNPPLVAELIAEVANNNILRERLIRAGKSRVEAYSPEIFLSNIKKIFTNHLGNRSQPALATSEIADGQTSSGNAR